MSRKEYSLTWEKCKELAKGYDMQAMLTHLGVNIKTFGSARMVQCPWHLDKTPSAEIRPGNLLYCHACSETGDNIKVYMALQGCSFRDAVNNINALQSHTPIEIKKIARQKESVGTATQLETDEEKVAKQKKRYQVFLSQFKEYSILSQNQKEMVDSYLKEKCLTDSVKYLEGNGCKIGLFWDKLDNKFYIAWWLKTWGIVVKERKQNMGAPAPTFLRVNSSATWMICEGMTDALSATSMGYNAISLNSTNQVDNLINKLSKNANSTKQEFIICTDNDAAGDKARLKLLTFFMKNNYKYSIYKDLISNKDKYNDLNEYYIDFIFPCTTAE